MSEKNVGAVPVMEKDQLVGILSERDYTRKVILAGRSSKETPVRDIMTNKALTASPSDTIVDCMRRMTENKVRHLPVMENGRMQGIISIGDLVNLMIRAQAATIDQLEGYLTGGKYQ
jgi:CBS domain-containing protein